MKETTSGTELMKRKQVLFSSNLSVVSFGSLGLKMFPLLHLFIVWKRNAIDTLQALPIAVTLPVGRGVLGQLEAFYFASVSDMRTPTQINQRTTPIHCSCWRIDLCHDLIIILIIILNLITV
jgi:hypothetical protein